MDGNSDSLCNEFDTGAKDVGNKVDKMRIAAKTDVDVVD